MPPRADAPLRKVTLNLYESDCVEMEQSIGHGWTEKVRQIIHEHRERMHQAGEDYKVMRTIEDLVNE